LKFEKLYLKPHFIFTCDFIENDISEDSIFSSERLLIVASAMQKYRYDFNISSSKYTRKSILIARKFFNDNYEFYKSDPKELMVDTEAENEISNGGCSMTIAILNI